MDNDKKELIYVMNLLKKQPHNEISKDYYTFKDKNMILVEKYYEKINDKFKTPKELFKALLCVSSIDKNYIQNLLSIQNK